jgi:hypothetical protein
MFNDWQNAIEAPANLECHTWDRSGQVVMTTLKTILLSIIILAGIAAWRAGMLT